MSTNTDPGGSIFIKLGISVGSLVVCLGLLEVSLRLAGMYVTRGRPVYLQTQGAAGASDQRQREYELHGAGASKRAIVCIGDSFTYGGNVTSDQTYPAYLSELMKARGDDRTVVNLGQCEDNSYGVKERLKTFLETSDDKNIEPEIVVVLAGSADRFNYAGLKEPTAPEDFVSSWRIYKMLRAIKLAYTHRELKGGGHDTAGGSGYSLIAASERTQPSRQRRSSTEFRARPTFDENQKGIDELMALYDVLKRSVNQARAGKTEEATADWRRVMEMTRHKDTYDKVLPDSNDGELPRPHEGPRADLEAVDFSDENTNAHVGDILQSTVIIIVQILSPKLRHDDAYEFLIDVMRTFPQVWDEALDPTQFQLTQVYQIQQKFDASDVVAALDHVAGNYPHLRDNAKFAKLYAQMQNSDAIEKEVSENRMATWEEIVAMAEARGIQLILQTYPTDYKAANKAIKEIAAKYNLPLVDNERRFHELVSRSGRRPFLRDDDHCTPAGYEIMGKYVYDEIRRLDQAKAAAAP